MRSTADFNLTRLSLSGALSWFLPVLVLSSALLFSLVARGDWLVSASALSRCRTLVGVAGPNVLGLALAPILLGGFGLGFFTFAGRDLSTGARVRGLFVCLLGLAVCALSLESFSERARGYAASCGAMANAQEAHLPAPKPELFVRPSETAASFTA